MAQAKPSQVRIPFAYITGLPRRAQEEIFRDFEEVTKAIIPANSLFDATIDPGLTQSNAGTHQYKNITDFTVGEAAKLIPTRALVVSVIARPGTSVVETSNITLGGSVTFMGAGLVSGSPFSTGGGRPVIDFSGHSITTPVGGWVTFEGIELSNSGAAIATLVTGNIALYDSMVNAAVGGVQSISLIASSVLFAHNSGFSGNTGHGAIRTYCFDCAQLFPVATTVGGSSQYFVWDGGTFDTGTGVYGIAVVADYHIRATCDVFIGGGASSTSPAVTLSAGSSGYLNMQSVSNINPSLTIAATAGDCKVEGSFVSVTVNGNSNNKSRNIRVAIPGGGAADITGPAKVDLSLSATASSTFVKLRGTGIRAEVQLAAYSAVSTPLQLIGCTDSLVTMEYPAGVGGVAYTIDAASARCTLVLAGVSDGWAAGTNAGTNCNVITELGSSAPSTVVSPSLLMGELAAIQSGVQTIPAPAAGVAGVAVGGSLAGTLVNPSFAGRDSSVDQINQDLLPAALLPAPGPVGVQVYGHTAESPLAQKSDISGTAPYFTITGLLGQKVSNASLTDLDILQYNTSLNFGWINVKPENVSKSTKDFTREFMLGGM